MRGGIDQLIHWVIWFVCVHNNVYLLYRIKNKKNYILLIQQLLIYKDEWQQMSSSHHKVQKII